MLTPHGWLELRRANGDADYRAAAGVHRQCYPQEAWTALDVEGFDDSPGNVVKVMALEDGPIIGTLLYRVREDAVQIARVAVLPQYRRCRAAAYAVRSLTGPTSPVRMGVYEARVHENNNAAIALMQKCGFAAGGLDREHYRDGRDAYVFQLFKEAPHRLRLPVSVS